MKRCKHLTLKIKAIQIAERCPDCFRFVTRDNRTYKTAQDAIRHNSQPKRQQPGC